MTSLHAILNILSFHPVSPLLRLKALPFTITCLLINIGFVILVFITSAQMKQYSSLKSPESNGLYSKLEFAWSGNRTNEIFNSLNENGKSVLGTQIGLEFAKSFMYYLSFMILMHGIAKILHTDTVIDDLIDEKQRWRWMNQIVALFGYMWTWILFVPCILHTIIHVVLYFELLHGATDSATHFVTLSIIIFYIFAVAVTALYTAIAGAYTIVLIILSRINNR
jgi:hypothetical protein